jgi:hypothetical protein
MDTLNFRTQDAKFHFNRKSVLKCLEHRKSSYDNQELDNLIKALTNQPENATLSLEEHRYFGFIVLDLIHAGEGSVTCNNCCGKQYRCNQLEDFTTGPDEIKSKVNTDKKRVFKDLFRKKPKPIGLSGGKGVKCPEGHELIFMISWIT